MWSANGKQSEDDNMARLNTLSDGDTTEFKRLLGAHIEAEDARKLMKHPEVIAAMAKTMSAHPAFHLIHDRFHWLDEKIRIVKQWPGISDRFSEADFKAAVEEAYDSGLLDRFNIASQKNCLLDVVVSVYLGSVSETFLYGRDRVRDNVRNTFGDAFSELNEETYEAPDLDERLVLVEGIKEYKNCLKVEVVDLGSNWNPKETRIPMDVRNTKSAHAQVLYAGAQDMYWIRQMDQDAVPFVLMGGYILTAPITFQNILYSPYLAFNGREASLGISRCNSPSYYALPVLWE